MRCLRLVSVVRILYLSIHNYSRYTFVFLLVNGIYPVDRCMLKIRFRFNGRMMIEGWTGLALSLIKYIINLKYP